MPDTQAQTLAAIKFELAMSVGESLEMEPMVRAFMRPLLQFVRGLSCQLWWRDEAGQLRRMAYLARSLTPTADNAGPQAWREAVALAGQARPQYTEIQAGHHLHALPLGEAGWLFIERLGAAVPAPVLGAIGVVLLRLAHACRACEQHEQQQVLLGQKAAAEAALREALSRLEDIFSLSSDGFVYFDGEARVAYCNPCAAQLLALQGPQLLAMDLPALQAWLGANAEPRNRHQLPGLGRAPAGVLQLATPQPRVLAWALRHKAAPASAFDAPFDAPPADVQASAVLYLRDITRESEIERLKTEFLHTAAHELRTPIVSVFGFSELMLRRPASEERKREMLDIIHRQSSLLVSLVDELLDLTRLEHGGARVLSRSPHELAALVGTTVQGLSIPGDSRQLQVGPLPAQALLHVDAKLFHRALLNVLTNAFKYSQGTGEITLQVLPGTLAESPAWGLRVTDQGIGMQPEQLARVCERFYRADQSGVVPGTGLGMSLVKEILDLHTGRIDIQSQPGQGTTVTLWWPAAAAPECADAPAALFDRRPGPHG
jgi:signal transduction histidine kinase